MAELQLWMAFLNRDDVQDLPAVDRMALISIATTVADNEPEHDAFLPRSALRNVPWGEGLEDLRRRVDGLASRGFLTIVDEPAGFVMVGWLEDVQRYRAGNPESSAIRWGQTSAAKWRARRAAARMRVARARQRQKEQSDASNAST